MKTNNRIILFEPDELIPIPPEIAHCDECDKPLKAQLIEGWCETGVKDYWRYDTTDGHFMFFLFCGCQDWKIEDVTVEDVNQVKHSVKELRCDCDLMDKYDRVGCWLEAQHITLCAHLRIEYSSADFEIGCWEKLSPPS
jgi:hypothetical protein